MRPVLVGVVLLAACGEKALEMTLVLPENSEAWDTSCIQTIEIYTAGGDYPENDDDYLEQTLDISDNPVETYAELKQAIRGRFDVEIPDSGLSAVEMYGWNGPSGFEDPETYPDLNFFARVPYTGQEPVEIELVANLDCRLQPVTVRPIDLLALVTTGSCAQAGVTDPEAYASLGTLSPGLYRPYLFGWGGVHGAPVTSGVAAFDAALTVGPQSCLAVYSFTDTTETGGCVTPFKACATGSEIEAVLIDDAYALSLDTEIQKTLRGGIVGAVLDGTRSGIAGATVTVDSGMVVYIRPDAGAKRLIPTAGSATDASGMFIIYSNDLARATVTANGQTKQVTVGAQRTYNDGTKAPAGVIVTF